MTFSLVKGAVCALALCLSLQAVADERCLDVSTSAHHDAVPVRKLTLSIGQSAASVSSDPALTDIVAAVPFEKGVAVYVNQPFDLTYKGEGLTFNVPRTHTLWMTSSDQKLTDVEVELCPLFENDFEAALRMLKQWKALFDDMKMEEIDNYRGIPIGDMESLGERFKSAKFPKFGQKVGIWKRGNTYVTLGLSRVEREYLDSTASRVEREAYVYKVWVSLLDSDRFNPK